MFLRLTSKLASPCLDNSHIDEHKVRHDVFTCNLHLTAVQTIAIYYKVTYVVIKIFAGCRLMCDRYMSGAVGRGHKCRVHIVCFSTRTICQVHV